MTTTSSPTASRTAASDRAVIPSGSRATEPVASLSSGRGSGKRMTPGTPSDASRRTSATSDGTVCWDTPGSAPHRPGLVEAVGHEQGRHQVVDAQPGLGHQATQGRGAAQAAQAATGEAGGGRGSGHGAPAYVGGAPPPARAAVDGPPPDTDAPSHRGNQAFEGVLGRLDGDLEPGGAHRRRW